MDFEQKFRTLYQLDLIPVKKIVRIGNSYGIIFPKWWIKSFCTKIDRSYWVVIKQDKDELILKPVDEDYIESIELEEIRGRDAGYCKTD